MGFAEDEQFGIGLNSVESFAMDISSSGGYSPLIYDGEYEVVPRIWSEVILDTQSKAMLRDVEVLRVPQYEVDY